MRPRRLVVPALFVAALFAVTIWRDRPTPAELWTFSGPTMGTEFTVKVVAGGLDETAVKAIETAILDVLEQVDASMSTWRGDSELSRFNDSSGTGFAASPELAAVVREALTIAEASDGALDVTVGPLVDAWGFGARGGKGEPDSAEIERLLAACGWRLLHVGNAGASLHKARPDLRVDLSSIAKGHAVDRVSETLDALGLNDHMVEIGGEVRASGSNREGRIWRIGVESPDPGAQAARVVVQLDGTSLATSGDYRNFRLVDGVRFSHTIDPRTGRPITHDLASVSVLAGDCATADGWATALNVLGPERGLELAERQGLAAYFIVRDGGAFAVRTSSSWPRAAGTEG